MYKETMNLKPLNSSITNNDSTGLIQVSNLLQKRAAQPNQIVVKKINKIQSNIKTHKVETDPTGILNNSVFTLIKHIKFKMIAILTICALIFLSASGWIAANYLIVNTSWEANIPGIIIICLAIYKLSISIVEYNAFNRDVLKYRADVKNGLTSTPPFILRIYTNMHLRQISHNWYTFFIFFFDGIFLISLYFLKNQDFWIFHFQAWIDSTFRNVELVEYIGLGILLSTILLQFVFVVFRKRRIYQIDSYFGTSIINQEALETRKKNLNKAYRRGFYFVLLVILLIPFLMWLMLKVIRKKT